MNNYNNQIATSVFKAGFGISDQIRKYKSTYLTVFLSCFCGQVMALEFIFKHDKEMDQKAIDGFKAAGKMWSEIYSDDITININIGFKKLDPRILGQTNSEKVSLEYEKVFKLLNNDSTSNRDVVALKNLQSELYVDLLLNRVSNSPEGFGDSTPFLDSDDDENNQLIQVTRANAKAFGYRLDDINTHDATITFSTEFLWDYSPENGISENHFSFIHVAAHEIGHMLGFVSGVDILDINSSGNKFFDDHRFTFVSPIDLFRFSTQSFDEGECIIDWTADKRGKYFSIDGGENILGEFSTGRNHGDGQQASHWKDNQTLGIMDPTVGTGELTPITTLDIQLFDVIGFDEKNALKRK